jgi:hypothetical protein
MNRRIVIAVVLSCLALIAGIYFYPRLFAPVAPVGSAESAPPQKVYYTCPMHPSVRQEGPGACPVCGMTLVKMTEGFQENIDRKRVPGE